MNDNQAYMLLLVVDFRILLSDSLKQKRSIIKRQASRLCARSEQPLLKIHDISVIEMAQHQV